MIRSIENFKRPLTVDVYIRSARSTCSGAADLLINSPLCDITIWAEFKARAEFFSLLYENRLGAKAPLDFYVMLEGPGIWELH